MEEKETSKIRPKSTKTTESNVIKMASGKTEERCDRTKSFPTSILSFSRKMAECNESNRVHPTQKPVALFEYLIRTYTNEGATVLDNCIGSGTTAIACINTGRNFIGIEKEEKYFKIAEERVKTHLTTNAMRFAGKPAIPNGEQDCRLDLFATSHS